MSELDERKKKRKKRKKAGSESSKESSLRDWFKRKGAKGKKGGWVDCNAPDGKGGYKSCGRSKGEKRKKYPACRPTPGACKERGRGKSWGKKGSKRRKSRGRKKRNESMEMTTEEIRTIILEELQSVLDEKKGKRRVRKKKAKKKSGKKDKCYYKVKRRYKVWPSAYASGALTRCRKVGAKNWGNKSKKKNESIEEEVIQEKKNCGCGLDPCKTYGKLNEDFKPHMMYDPKSDKKEKTEKIEDHERLAKKGYVHVDPEVLRKVLRREGGASGMDPFLKEVGEEMKDEVKKALEAMPDVGQHKDKDYILDDDKEIRIMKEATYDDGSPVEEGFGFYETLNEEDIVEAVYAGKKVKLNKPMRGDVKKFKVYVNSGKKDSKGRIKAKKVNFGHGGTSAKRKGEKTMRIRKNNPKARRNFRKRHNCANPGPKTKARYWSCRKW